MDCTSQVHFRPKWTRFWRGSSVKAGGNVVFCESKEEHDRNLKNLMEGTTETGMVLNGDKSTIEQKRVSFGYMNKGTGLFISHSFEQETPKKRLGGLKSKLKHKSLHTGNLGTFLRRHR